MKKIFFLSVVLLAFSASVFAESTKACPAEQFAIKYFSVNGSLLDSGKKLVAEANSQSGKMPFFLKPLAENAKINFYIKCQNGKATVFGITTKAGKISEAKAGALDGAKFFVYSDDATVKTIAESKQPQKDLETAIKTKKITISASGFMDKIKIKAALFMLDAGSTIGSITGKITFFLQKG